MCKKRRACAGAILLVGLFLGVSLTGIACAPSSKAPSERLTIAGGTVGGMGNLMASAWSGVAKKYLGIDSTVTISPSMSKPQNIQDKDCDIANSFTFLDYDAYNGVGTWAGRAPYRDLRVLYYGSQSSCQILVPVDSKIQSFRDLVGKRVCPGREGFISIYDMQMACQALGLSYEKDFNLSFMGHPEASAALVARKVDAYVLTGDPPHATFAQTDLTFPLRMLSFSKEEIDTLLKVHPFLNRVVWQGGKYYHTKETTLTFGTPVTMLASNRLSEDIAYGLVKNIFEHPEFLGYYHISMQNIITEGTSKEWAETLKGCPLHPGAIRYYKEAGFNIPAEVIPPEYKK